MSTDTESPPTMSESEVEIVAARDEVIEREQAYVDARSRFRELVSAYLEDGGSPTVLGKILGVTRGRIYQYRNSWAAENDDAATG